MAQGLHKYLPKHQHEEIEKINSQLLNNFTLQVRFCQFKKTFKPVYFSIFVCKGEKPKIKMKKLTIFQETGKLPNQSRFWKRQFKTKSIENDK